jgi:hypothetical protein
MRRGEPRKLVYTARHGQLTAAHSIKDIYDLVVELLTNADDSYTRLSESNGGTKSANTILLEVEPRRGSNSSVVRVRDRAAGFTNLQAKIERVGERTSRSGDRGFMGRGLKDCAALGSIMVETIVDGYLNKIEITSKFEVVTYEANSRTGDRATKKDRKRLGIPRGNGTVVEVSLNPKTPVPRLETLRRKLPSHYALRDIMSVDSDSRVILRYSGRKNETLLWTDPDRQLVHDREHEVPGYPGRRFRFKLWRSAASLSDPGDPRFRRTGILVKGKKGIHGCSFLVPSLGSDPAIDRYFGRIECADIDKLAEEWDERRARGELHPEDNPTFILDPNRRIGLAIDHPFVQQLYKIPVEVLKEQFESERKRQKSSQKEVEAKETTKRLQRLAREASRFMRDKLEDINVPVPGDIVNHKAFNERGIGVSPAFTQIPIGAQKTYTVKVNNEKLDLPSGTLVKVTFSKAAATAVELVGRPTVLEIDPLDERVLKGSFTLVGVSLSSRVQVGCQLADLPPVFTELQVVSTEPVDRDIPGDFSFHRKEYSVRHGSRRTLLLRARFGTPDPPPVTVRLTDPDVAIPRASGAFELVPGTTYYEASFTMEGRKIHGKTLVIATANGRNSEARLRVVEREEPTVALKFQLVDHDLGTNYRAVWDRQEPNTLLITTSHDSIGRYLGTEDEGYPGQHGDAFRVLLAELISDNVCRRIVEAHARAQPHEFDSDDVYRLHNRLMKEFTPLAHNIQLASPSVQR